MGGGINSVMGYHSMFERSPGLGVVCGGARSYVLQSFSMYDTHYCGYGGDV